jgi:transglutaminase-like putative cysteine protease
MRLGIRHRTVYRYATPVRDSYNEVRLRPVSNEHQRVEQFELHVTPNPSAWREYDDFYANAVHHFEVPNLHQELQIESRCVVSTNNVNIVPAGAMLAPMERRAECQRMERCFDYLQASNYVQLTPDLWRAAVDVTYGASDMWQAASALSHFVFGHMTYLPASTNALTLATEAFGARRGVCQDFAHVLIGLCRSIQIPALYVSGYLCTPETQATHAWVEVFLPGTGWRALDPTHDSQADERYVKIAVGRDYLDVPPTSGQFKGTKNRSIEVDVKVDNLPELNSGPGFTTT